MKKILLVNPRYDMETLRVSDEKSLAVRADNMPLGLATVAALTPDDFSVEIWDEFVRGPVESNARFLENNYDLVGLTSTRVTILRAIDIASFFKEKGVLVAIGGPGVSGSPDRCRAYFDILFIGEAELTWPAFLADWRGGSFKKEYRQIEKPAMHLSPKPRWDSIVDDVPLYSMGSVQTTRGCPYDCEFCDVVYLNGRIQRHKDIDRVIEEVEALRDLGVTTVYFADDNLIGNHQYAKKLLRKLIPLNAGLPAPLRFATQASIDVARDEELLELLADANFYEMLIGIESTNEQSLKEIGKFNNLKGNLVEEVHKILSYGISVRGALICGFDHDGLDVFDNHIQFINEAFLPAVSLHMLNAPIGTRLWRRMREEGRVIDIFKITDKVTRRIISNIIPRQMSRMQLMEGFAHLYSEVFSWESFEKRMKGFVSLTKYIPQLRQKTETADDILTVIASMGLDQREMASARRIFSYTEQRAPFLLPKVKALVIQFVRYSGSARDLIPKIKSQIELERSGALQFELDNRPITIPTAFLKAYSDLFPGVYRRTYLSLTEKENVSACVMEIFVEFLVHESEFSGIEPYHQELLEDITDRTCARVNGVNFEDFTPIAITAATPPVTWEAKLHEEILKGIEQELIKLIQGDGGGKLAA